MKLNVTKELNREAGVTLLRPVLVALMAASARLGVVLAIAAWLAVILMNEVAAALVFVIASVLALFAFS